MKELNNLTEANKKIARAKNSGGAASAAPERGEGR